MPVERQCKGTALRVKSMLGAWRLLGCGPEGWLEMGITFQNLEDVVFISLSSLRYPKSSKPVWLDGHVRIHGGEAVQCQIQFKKVIVRKRTHSENLKLHL